jgi:hypothetical protein
MNPFDKFSDGPRIQDRLGLNPAAPRRQHAKVHQVQFFCPMGIRVYRQRDTKLNCPPSVLSFEVEPVGVGIDLKCSSVLARLLDHGVHIQVGWLTVRDELPARMADQVYVWIPDGIE